MVEPDNASSSKTLQYVYDFGKRNDWGYGVSFGDEYYGMYTPINANGVASEEISHSFGTAPTIIRFQVDFSADQNLHFNGEVAATETDATGSLTQLTASEINELATHASSSGPVTIGQQCRDTDRALNDGRYFDGSIGEIIVYAEDMSNADIMKVESYLAIKYGITLDATGGGTAGDYLATDGTTIWDASDGSGYHNDLVVVGRDDGEVLYQKQSRTKDDSLVVYIDALAADNNSNSGTITNDVSS